MFRLAYAQPAYVRLGLEALDGWRRLEAETDRTLVELTGGLDHGEIDGLVDVLAAAAVACERVTPKAAAERWPGLVIDRAAVWHQPAGRIWADRAVRAFQDRAAALGAELRFDASAVEVATDGDGARV